MAFHTHTFFSDISNMLLNGMGTNMFSKAANLISGVSPLFQAGFGVYILLLSLNYYKNGLDENIVDLTRRMIGWLIIIAFAFNAGQYIKLANILFELPDQLSGLLGSQAYTASALDTSFNNLMQSLSTIADYAAGLNPLMVSDKLMLYCGIAIIVICGGLFFALSLAYYIIAKLSLAMVLVIGPIFIGSFLFPATRQWGMNWIGQILNYSVTITFFTILGALQQTFFTNVLQNAIVGDISSVAQVLAILPLFVLSTIIFILVAWNIPSIASALTGGASVNGFSRTLLAGYAWAKTKGFSSFGGKGGSVTKK